MSLQALTEALGLKSYPAKLEELYGRIDKASTALCGAAALEETEAELSLFGELFPEVLSAARALSSTPSLLAYANLGAAYLALSSLSEASSLPCPATDGTAERDLLPLFFLLPSLPACIRRYREHGFSAEETRRFLGAIPTCLKIVRAETGRLGLNQVYFNWLLLYLYGTIFDHGSFNFQLTHLSRPAMLLRHKASGEHALLMTGGRFHRDGQVLGSAGYEDERLSFAADFTETEEAVIGHETSKDGFVLTALSTFPKSDWECVLREGDPILSVHIPRRTDLSEEAVRRSYEEGLQLAARHYPEHGARYLYCSSWIIDTRLRPLLGEDSRIVRFGDTFHRLPVRSSGRDGTMFFFPGHTGEDEALPEGTSLQRKIKALYLGGGHTYTSAGFVTDIHR